MRERTHFLFFLIVFFLGILAAARASDDRTQFGRDIVIQPGEDVDDALCFLCSIHVRGNLTGDAVSIGGGIEIEGTVVGDVVAAGGGVRLGPTAKMEGDLVAVGGALERDPKASISGDVVSAPWFSLPGQRQWSLRGLLVMIGLSCGLALVTALSARARRVEIVADTLRARPGMVLLTGMGVLVGATALYVVSNYLGRAQPVLAIAVSLALLISVMVGYTGLSSLLGRRLARHGGYLVSVLLGALLIAFVQLIPILGFFAFLAFFLLALGGAALSGYGSAAGWLFRPFASQPVVPPASPPSAV